MQDTILQRLAATYWWEYAFYIYMFFLSWKATKPREVIINSFLVSAIFFFFIALCLILLVPEYVEFKLDVLLLSTMIGYLFGLTQYILMKIPAIPSIRSLKLPGTWSWLVVTAALVVSRFYVPHQAVNHANSLLNANYQLLFLAADGLFTGLFLGRYRYAKRCLKIGPFIDATR